MYLLNLSLAQLFRPRRGALSVRPVAPPPGGFHAALLGAGRATRRGRKAAAHPTTVVVDSATGRHGAADAGHGAVALGGARAGRKRPRAHPRNLGLDGGALRQSHSHGPGPRPRATVPSRPSRARPRHAGARRRPGHTRHGIRARPPKARSGHKRISARRHRAESRPSAGIRAPYSISGRRARGRDRGRRHGAHGRARCRRHPAAASQPSRAPSAGCHRELRPAQGGRAALRHRPRPMGNLRLRAQLRNGSPHRDTVARFWAAG